MSVFAFLGGFFLGTCVGILLPDVFIHLQKPIVLNTLPHDEAKQIILDYITQNKGKRTSDIIFDLKLDPGLALSVLRELHDENEVEAFDLSKQNTNKEVKK